MAATKIWRQTCVQVPLHDPKEDTNEVHVFHSRCTLSIAKSGVLYSGTWQRESRKIAPALWGLWRGLQSALRCVDVCLTTGLPLRLQL